MLYTLAELERITGAKRRSLQLWTDAGVIVAESSTMHAGSGTHRRFSKDEAIIACAVHAFARQQMSIGGLKEVATAIRMAMGSQEHRALVDDAIAGKGQCYLISERWGDEGWTVSLMGGPELPTSDAKTARSFVAALVRSTSHLQEPNGFASLILLNTYAKALSL